MGAVMGVGGRLAYTFALFALFELFTLIGFMALSGCTERTKVTGPPDVPPIRHGALVYATAMGDEDAVQKFLSQGADINEDVGTSGNHITPLLTAAAIGNEKLVLSLLAKGASTYHAYQGYLALDFAFHTFGDQHPVYRSLENNPKNSPKNNSQEP